MLAANHLCFSHQKDVHLNCSETLEDNGFLAAKHLCVVSERSLTSHLCVKLRHVSRLVYSCELSLLKSRTCTRFSMHMPNMHQLDV